MASALKKHLTRMAIQPNDVVIYRVALGEKAPPDGFLKGVAAELTGMGAGALIVMREGESINSIDGHHLAHAGLVRIFNPSRRYTPAELDDMEFESLRHVRLAFTAIRERLNGEGGTDGSRAPSDTPETTAGSRPD